MVLEVSHPPLRGGICGQKVRMIIEEMGRYRSAARDLARVLADAGPADKAWIRW